MAEFRNMLGSDEDSNEDIDHIPKTPGPPLISDHESDEDKSGDEKEEEVKNNSNDSDSSSSQSDSSNDNNRNTRNDSEVERSDNENEDKEVMQDNRKTVKAIDTNQPNDDMSSDENEDNDDKNVNESQDNDSEDEDIVRRVSPKKKRQLEDNSDSSEDVSSDRIKKQRIESNDIEENDDKSDDNKDIEDKNEEMVDKSAKAKDIFGEMSSEDEDEDEDRPKDSRKDDEKDSDRESGNENKDNQRRDEESGDEETANREGVGEQTFGDEEEPQEEPIPETRIEVEIPRIVADLGREVHFVKLPNFLSIDTHPYDPQWYEDEIDEDENLDDEGRARLKLKVENTIRWRNVVDKETNELKKESNTRVVRWSDGTYSLHLGEEIFDIHKLQLMTGDNNHLFIRQGTGLQGQTVFRSKLNFRPFSTESFTHRKLTLSLADRSQKTQKIRVLPNVGKDPEAHRTEMIKKEEDRLKASIRREHKQKRMRESRLTRGPTASYLEPDGDEDEDEEGISLARIKNQYKRGSFNKSYDDPELSPEESKEANDDDDSEDDLFDKKTEKRRATHIVDNDDE